MGLGKEVGWKASQAHPPPPLDIFLLQLVIPRLGSLQKYHDGIKFTLLFSPQMHIFLRTLNSALNIVIIIIIRTLTDF